MKGDFEGAAKFYDQVIRMDPVWSAFAHYNRAYCTLQMKGGGYIRRAIDDLTEALCKLEANKKQNMLFEVSINASNFSFTKRFESKKARRNADRNNRLAVYHITMEYRLLHIVHTQIVETIEKLETNRRHEG